MVLLPTRRQYKLTDKSDVSLKYSGPTGRTGAGYKFGPRQILPPLYCISAQWAPYRGGRRQPCFRFSLKSLSSSNAEESHQQTNPVVRLVRLKSGSACPGRLPALGPAHFTVRINACFKIDKLQGSPSLVPIFTTLDTECNFNIRGRSFRARRGPTARAQVEGAPDQHIAAAPPPPPLKPNEVSQLAAAE